MFDLWVSRGYPRPIKGMKKIINLATAPDMSLLEVEFLLFFLCVFFLYIYRISRPSPAINFILPPIQAEREMFGVFWGGPDNVEAIAARRSKATRSKM